MRRILTATALSSLYLLTLSACATAPSADTLMAGIDTSNVTKIAPGELRKPTDPVCVNFYKNAQGYLAEANKPDRGKSFLTRLGIGVLAGVASGGIATAGIDSVVGQIAVQQVAATTIYEGSNIALQELNKANGPQAKVIKAAEEIGCPVNVTV